MKTLVLLSLLSWLAHAAEPVKTNARLRDDEMVYPQPEAPAGTKVTATLKSDVIVCEIAQGNWMRSEHVLTYEVSNPPEGFPHKELVFVCRDTNPTPESGIKVKKVAWPFAKGAMTFFLSRDESVRHAAYFNIVSYQPEEARK